MRRVHGSNANGNGNANTGNAAGGHCHGSAAMVRASPPRHFYNIDTAVVLPGTMVLEYGHVYLLLGTRVPGHLSTMVVRDQL